MGNIEKDRESKRKFHQIIKNRINQLCKENGYTYYQLSYRASLPMTTLVHIMNEGSSNPGIYTIMKICDGFGITLKAFFDSKEFEEAIAELRDEK